jgi:hypothetical protein
VPLVAKALVRRRDRVIGTYRLDIYRVEETVPELAAFLTNAKRQNRNALWTYFGIRQSARLSGADPYADAKFALMLTELGDAQREADPLNAQLRIGSPRTDDRWPFSDRLQASLESLNGEAGHVVSLHRLVKSGTELLIASEKKIPIASIKRIADEALLDYPALRRIVVIDFTGRDVLGDLKPNRHDLEADD